jgi:hypothetical protein
LVLPQERAWRSALSTPFEGALRATSVWQRHDRALQVSRDLRTCG